MARDCAEHVASFMPPFEVTLEPRVHVDGEVEDRAAIYSADQTLRARWVEATPHACLLRLHRLAMAFLGKEAHAFEPHASLHYFQSGELDPAQKAKMLDEQDQTWRSQPQALWHPEFDEWKAIAFYPFTGRVEAREDS
eukprot:CAMPEP_0194170726 /NCGR_PEP_ID=MMETSP0154-20130528/5394_1 /TAXON_ID=1049557 /ORGANISM="Thalassiothrix antarctica, Strain L6-D1" /LENGTH=137 /DNA_ID=CAMNT_0038882735 /DNA_START=180 /DNA_END=594 /DNA_ORIENTATION=+